MLKFKPSFAAKTVERCAKSNDKAGEPQVILQHLIVFHQSVSSNPPIIAQPGVSMASALDIDVDVLVVGAGPVGLNLAYQLRRFSSPPIADPSHTEPISVRVLEALPKSDQEKFGRAVTFWPRSVEMLSQLELGDLLMQHCVAVRSSAAYNAKGEEVFGRGWSFLEEIADTRYKFASVLRQKYVEDIFRAKSKALGVEVKENHRFLDLQVMEHIPVGDKGRVRARVLDVSLGEHLAKEYIVNCRYLIGCDGSRTVVRGAAGIKTSGSRTEDKWVRVDGVLKSTTMPKPRSYGSLESPIYGNVLWIPLDHGATRIGYALPEDRGKLYKESTGRAFTALDNDWRKHFCAKESIFIAGDAAHSHSSGAGQGMNTGMHDAVNLGWKLALVLTGVLRREVLATYQTERWPNASKLIKYDEDISTLVTGRLPDGWKGNKSPNLALGEIFKEANGFNTGLTIGYEPNVAVWRVDQNGNKIEHDLKESPIIPAPAIAGYRAPDVQLLLPALWEPVWLQDLTINVARFYVLVFLGKSPESRDDYRGFISGLAGNGRLKIKEILGEKRQTVGLSTNGSSVPTHQWPVDFISVLPTKVSNAWAEIGSNPLGNVYYDTDNGSAGRRYDVLPDSGAVFVLRPDGFIGARFPLAAQSSVQLISYLSGLLY
ncbi:hypothetical protein G7046_g3860 [Stylonectria norvegica]|nr:hypothetical protein G7046_g3860 [Stylonectria norvegica]